jgi:NAD(P)-dependent dehydrogenase (short-subunit alcohol dehydrogenase family)
MKTAIYPSLKDRTVLITGGASGIGSSMVEHFVEQGSKVFFLDTNLQAGSKIASKTGAEFIVCDVRDITLLRNVISRISKITVLVNNAANDDRHSMETVEPEYWDERMATNLRHQFFAAQSVVPHMKEVGSGSIINLGSVSWVWRLGGMTAYTTAKAGVRGLTRGLARDLGGFGIRVNEVVPGWIFTERQEALWANPEAVAAMMKQQCIAEKLRCSDVARLVLWLAADDSRLVTAQSFPIDAGSS